MLKLKDVSKFYYNKGMISTGFTKINLELKIGEFVAITGESGSGKSTLLNVLSGLDSYEEGEMYINGKETSHYTEKDFEDYRRKYIANIFQSFNLINSYTVYQNVELVLLLNGYKKKQVKQKVLDMIEKVGLTEFKNTKVSKLSGGQKQRVAIARAMVKETPIIVADEPTGNLDANSAKDVIELLKKVAKDRLVIVVTHNVEQIEQYATRIIKMHDGKIIENKEIKKIEEPEHIEESKYNRITVANLLRLGIRNTFNILPKFLLLFAVFLFVTVALLSEYASFKQTEYEAGKIGYNYYFRDLSSNRIIIKKQDKTAFTSEDYAKIEEVENVNYIERNDLLLDTAINLECDDLYFYGKLTGYKRYKGTLTAGRMPQEDNEIIMKIPDDYYYVQNNMEDVLEKEFAIRKDNESDGQKFKLRIVGIETYKVSNLFYYGPDTTFYASDAVLNKMRKAKPKKRILLPDPKFNDVLVTRFVNNLMVDGKKSIAYTIFYDALDIVGEKMKDADKAPLEIWKQALENITPQVEVKSRRIGGATFQVPTEVRPERKISLSMKNLVLYSRKRAGKSMAEKLSAEIIAAYNQEGAAFKRKEEMHRMAEANKAFAHFRF